MAALSVNDEIMATESPTIWKAQLRLTKRTYQLENRPENRVKKSWFARKSDTITRPDSHWQFIPACSLRFSVCSVFLLEEWRNANEIHWQGTYAVYSMSDCEVTLLYFNKCTTSNILRWIHTCYHQKIRYNKDHIVQLCDYIGSKRLARFVSDNRLKAVISQVTKPVMI